MDWNALIIGMPCGGCRTPISSIDARAGLVSMDSSSPWLAIYCGTCMARFAAPTRTVTDAPPETASKKRAAEAWGDLDVIYGGKSVKR